MQENEWQVDEEPLEDYSRDDSANKSLKRRLVEKILQEKGVSQNSGVFMTRRY